MKLQEIKVLPEIDTSKMNKFSVQLYGDIKSYNDTLSSIRCRILYLHGNRNGTYITDEFAEELIKSLPYTPIKGIYEDSDYTDHGTKSNEGRIYGIVPENPNVTWESHADEDGELRTYMCADVLLYTALYEEATEIVGKSLSMELYDKSIDGNWCLIDGSLYFVFKEGSFLGLQVLGDDVEPCFEGAAFYSKYKEIYQLSKDKEELVKTKIEKEGTNMKKVNFRLSDNSKYQLLWSSLNTNFNEAGGWMVDYAIQDVYDDYAVAYKYEDGHYYRVYYNKDEKEESVVLGKVERCFMVDVTEEEKNTLETLQSLNGGTYEKVDEVYQLGQNLEEKTSEFSTKIDELNTKYSTLEQEKEEVSQELASIKEEKENISQELDSIKAENQELVEYKKGVEKLEKEEVISNYSKVLSKEILKEYSDKMEEYTAEELDMHLAYAYKKSNPLIFSKQTVRRILKDDDASKTGIEAILDKYC